MNMMTIRYFDSGHRGPLHESEVQGMVLDDGTIALRPIDERNMPATAAFAEIWCDDRKVFGGTCSLAGHQFIPVVDGMTKNEVEEYVNDGIRLATAPTGARPNTGGARPNTGGARPGAGRPRKTPAIVDIPVTEFDDPVTFLQAVMNDKRVDTKLRIDCARGLLMLLSLA